MTHVCVNAARVVSSLALTSPSLLCKTTMVPAVAEMKSRVSSHSLTHYISARGKSGRGGAGVGNFSVVLSVCLSVQLRGLQA